MNRPLAISFIVIFLLCTAYRIIPYEMRPEWLGAPQLAMAVFAGSVIKSRRYAFAIPLLSMFLSDLVMQGLHTVNPAYSQGFYSNQLINYALILSTTVLGFFVNHRKPLQVVEGALAAPIVYFLLSNFQVWLAGEGLLHAKTFGGLMQTYMDGLPFFKASLLGTLVFAGVFFGGYNLISAKKTVIA